ncbi:uncharacterized protein [Chironomus tepperi]|uniref:uncharacterized protein n=1 Tax=Chironomus tepperi TaxID=113505 RepID=UPI00391F12E7
MAKEHAENLEHLHVQLQSLTKYDEVMQIARKIFYMKITHESTTPEFEQTANSVIKILLKHFGTTKIMSFHKVLMLAIVKLSVLGNVNVFEDIQQKYALEYGVVGANCLSAYGRLQNHKLFWDHVYSSQVLYDTLIECSLKYSKTTKFFSMAIENYIQAYDIKIVKNYDPFIITMICSNLENCHKNIHKLLIDLFQRIVVNEKNADKEIIDLILNKMSWHNRNKHYLLIQVISNRPEMLLNYNNFDINKFINGLRIGLSQYHLYSSSLSLIKVIYNNETFRQPLIEVSTDIIINGSDNEMTNFFRFWFTCFDDNLKNDLFYAITNNFNFNTVSSVSPFFYRSLVITNAFNRPLSQKIENAVKNYCCSIDDVNIKLEIFNILLNSVYSSKIFNTAIENILRLIKFIHFNMCVEDSLFVDTVMRKLPNFFIYLATTRFRSIDVCKEIFTIIRDDIFNHGIIFGTYESRYFSLKILEVILKQYCGSVKQKRLSKKSGKNNSMEFKTYLKDNNIWDITSVENFKYLIDMSRDTENSDISRIANEIILEYFIKTLTINENTTVNGKEFTNWIDSLMTENLNISDIESYHENISYCKMKIEYMIAKHSLDIFNELEGLISNLEARHIKLNLTKDPISAIQNGESVFPLIDTINYFLSRIDIKLLTKKILTKLLSLAEGLTQQFLSFISDGITPPSFDLLDKHLHKLIELSEFKSDDISDTKHKLLISFFFTTRSLSEFSVALAKIISYMIQPHEDDYIEGVSTCINVNIQILSRFCHKGAIEASSQSLGAITKIISSEFIQQCDRNSNAAKNLQKLLIILKHELDCGKRHASKTGEIRGSRGLVLMSFLIVKNHPPFIKFLMERLLNLKEIKSFYDTQDIKFAYDIKPIHVHLLALIVKDSELVEDMLPYYDYILIATFRAYKESKDFVMQNALLQIIGSLTPKISNHKRHNIEESDKPRYESKAISVFEHYVKFTYAFRIALYDFENNLKDLSQTYIIILLEILSNFEVREPFEYWSEMDRMGEAFKKLIDHPCEKIRVLAARCYAQWHLPHKMYKVINDKIRYIFREDPNLAHGSIIAVQYMIQRYEASVQFVEDFNKEEFLMKMREKVSKSFRQSYSVIPKNFYLRCYLFDFLMFIGFNFSDGLVQELMNEDNVNSTIGYPLWRKRIQESISN